jgi:hypothetical protein
VHMGNWKMVAARGQIEAAGPRHGDNAKKERGDLLALTVPRLGVDKLQVPTRARRRSASATGMTARCGGRDHAAERLPRQGDCGTQRRKRPRG